MTVAVSSARGECARGDVFRVRRARPGDRAAVEAMFGRCGFRTRYYRFHAPVRLIPERYLTSVLSGRPDVCALVARGPSGEVTALASGHLTVSGASPCAMEIGILVEDQSQRHGCGRLLLERVVAEARHRGIGVIEAVILREQAWVLRLLRAYGTCETSIDGGAIAVTLRLRDTGLGLRDTGPR